MSEKITPELQMQIHNQGWENYKRKILMFIDREIDTLQRWDGEKKQTEYIRALRVIEQYIEDDFVVNGGDFA